MKVFPETPLPEKVPPDGNAFKVTIALFEQIGFTGSIWILIILKVITISSEAAIQGPIPSGSRAVNVNVTLPANKSAALGVYVVIAFEAFAKTPVPDVVHRDEFENEIEPVRLYGVFGQILASEPALAIGGLMQLQLTTTIGIVAI